MIYKLQNGLTIPLGGDYLEYLQSIPETYGGSIQPSIKVESLPKKFNGSQKAARTYAEGYQKGAKPVTKAIDNAGQKIFNTTKNVAMFVPGPTGAITWLGQMGADTANGEYSKVAKDLGAAILIGAGLKGVQAGAKAAGRALAGKGVNIPWLDAYDYSALRNEYFTNAWNKAMAKATPDIVQTNIEAGKLGWAPSSKQTLWHNSEQPLTRLKIDFPAWDVTERGAPLGHTWLTGTETTEGFLGARPYHLKGNIQLSKPMIQIGEAIGNGKNNTRNQILDFAQKSSADAINFKGISDNTLQNQDVYSVFKNVDLNDNLKLDGILRTRGSAQEAATTYHFDRRMPLSRPISEAELKGDPRGERNNIVQQHSILQQQANAAIQSRVDRPAIFKTWTLEEIANEPDLEVKSNMEYSRKQALREANKDKTYGYLVLQNKDSADNFRDRLQSYINTLENVELIPELQQSTFDGIQIQSPTIKAYRNYLDGLGYHANDISNDDLSKFLQHEYNKLVEQQSGKVKGKLLWHGSPVRFDQFSLDTIGEYTNNNGAIGPGIYFSSTGSPYGGYRSVVDYSLNIPNFQPYLIDGIKSTPEGHLMREKGIIPEYIGRSTGYSPEQVSEWMRSHPTPKDNNRLFVNPGSGSRGPYHDRVIGSEFMYRGDRIKSLFPHPDLLIVDSNENITMLPRKFEPGKLNYKHGGKI